MENLQSTLANPIAQVGMTLAPKLLGAFGTGAAASSRASGYTAQAADATLAGAVQRLQHLSRATDYARAATAVIGDIATMHSATVAAAGAGLVTMGGSLRNLSFANISAAVNDLRQLNFSKQMEILNGEMAEAQARLAAQGYISAGRSAKVGAAFDIAGQLVSGATEMYGAGMFNKSYYQPASPVNAYAMDRPSHGYFAGGDPYSTVGQYGGAL